MIKYALPQENKELNISIEDFVKLYKKDKAILLDVRMPFERELWEVKFAIKLSPNEIEENINKLPKDKLIITVCPNQKRSPFVAVYLKEKGFNAKFLDGGLIELMQFLKGKEAKNFKERK